MDIAGMVENLDGIKPVKLHLDILKNFTAIPLYLF